MDLIDASNVPVPVTMDPITGNTISANKVGNVTEDVQMRDGEATNNDANDDADNFIIDNSPTSQEFSALPSDTKAKIVRLVKTIGPFWNELSPATPFPPQYLPDPDVHNWGLALLTALHRLAGLTRTDHKSDAIYYILRSMKERNDISGNSADEGNPSSKLKRRSC
jgi:hypothetical protein